MKYDIPFNEVNFKQQMKLNFDLVWNINFKKNKKNFFWSIGYIILGILIINWKSNLGYIFIAIGLHFLIISYRYYSFYKKNKNRYFNSINLELEVQKNLNFTDVLEFNEDYFFFKNHKMEAKINWIAFKNFRIVNKNLFLYIDELNTISYILGQNEIGDNEFEKVIRFIETKVNKNKI